jgi:two-component system sensor histidine kinase KdpD
VIAAASRRPALDVLAERRPSLAIGLLVSFVTVTLATAACYPLKLVAPAVSLSVVYIPPVLLASAVWGLRLGIATSIGSAAAFNFFHLPPVGRFTIADPRNWVALAAFSVIAVVISAMANVVRTRTIEAGRRQAEADLAAAMARELLAGTDTPHALATASRRLSAALGLGSAAIELGEHEGDERRRALPLRDASGAPLGTLLVPRTLPAEALEMLRARVVPTLAAMVGLALERDAIQAEAVETAALRRSDDVKTALLRAVSHDLRTPLTTIVAAGHALGSATLTSDDRAELAGAIVDEGERLASLVEKLLDLSRLQGGGATPRREWVSIEDVLLAAREGLGPRAGEVRIAVPADLPDVRADAAQLERAFANLLENANRYSQGAPVHIGAVDAGDRVVISVVDQGPGVAPAERERIFEPFYRGRQAGEERWAGSGLGLAIARGFIEGGGGTITVESLPGQGTTFVVSLPAEPHRPAVRQGAGLAGADAPLATRAGEARAGQAHDGAPR